MPELMAVDDPHPAASRMALWFHRNRTEGTSMTTTIKQCWRCDLAERARFQVCAIGAMGRFYRTACYRGARLMTLLAEQSACVVRDGSLRQLSTPS